MRPIAVRYRHTPATLPDAIGIGPLNMVVVSEIFPFRLRAVAMSLALFLNRLVSGAVASSFLSLTEMLSAEGLRLPGTSPHPPRTLPAPLPAPLPATSPHPSLHPPRTPPCTSAHRRIAAALHLGQLSGPRHQCVRLPTGTFLLFAAIAFLSWLFVLRRVPETRGRSLEEMEAFFEQLADEQSQLTPLLNEQGAGNTSSRRAAR